MQLFFLVIKVEIEFFIKPEHGRLNESVHCTTVFLCWATSTTSTIYETADALHFQEFILLRICHVLVYLRNEFRTYTVFYCL